MVEEVPLRAVRFPRCALRLTLYAFRAAFYAQPAPTAIRFTPFRIQSTSMKSFIRRHSARISSFERDDYQWILMEG